MNTQSMNTLATFKAGLATATPAFQTRSPHTAGLVLRPGRPEDAAVAGRICFEAFSQIAEKHGFPPDFPGPAATTGMLHAFLSRPDIYSVVAELDGRIVGSNFLWENALIAGVGPITIDPAVQDGSIGRRLMEAVLQRAQAQHFAGVRLVQAAYHNRSLSLYTKLGFAAREPLSVLQGAPLQAEIPGYTVRPATTEDVPACNRLYLRVHGHAREHDLQEAIAGGTATVVEHRGRITGYATLIGFFGHAVGESNESLKALIGAAPTIHGVGLLLPTRNAELFRWCLERGLRVVQPLTLMSLGLYNEPAGAFLPSILY